MAQRCPLYLSYVFMSFSYLIIVFIQGMGAIYIRRRPRVRLEPLMSGGGQERGLRSGTLAPALCVGFGEACRIGQEELKNDHEWVTHLSKRLIDGIMNSCPEVVGVRVSSVNSPIAQGQFRWYSS